MQIILEQPVCLFLRIQWKIKAFFSFLLDIFFQEKVPWKRLLKNIKRLKTDINNVKKSACSLQKSSDSPISSV